MMSTCYLLVCIGLFVGASAGGDWSYSGEHGKAHWGATYSHCGQGMKQSPINLETDKAQYKDSLANFHLEHHNIDKEKDKMFLFNNGHTLQLQVDADFVIRGGSLGDVYKVAQLHFHWGKDSNQGSEHHKNSEAYPLEMHIVSYDMEKYNSLGEAVGKDGGLAVLGVLFKVSKFHNKHMDPIIEHIKGVLHPNALHKVPVPVFNLQHLLPSHTKYYYRYEGSLTTPGCNETVIWTVMDMPQFIGEPQLAIFRHLLAGPGVHLVDNFRDPQPLKERTVYRSFPNKVEYVIIHDIQVNEAADTSAASCNQLSHIQLAFALTAAAIFWLRH